MEIMKYRAVRLARGSVVHRILWADRGLGNNYNYGMTACKEPVASWRKDRFLKKARITCKKCLAKEGKGKK